MSGMRTGAVQDGGIADHDTAKRFIEFDSPQDYVIDKHIADEIAEREKELADAVKEAIEEMRMR